MGVAGETKILDKAFRIGRLDESVMQHLGSDCRPLGIKPPVNWTPPPSQPGMYEDIWGITWKKVSCGDKSHFWEHYGSPLAAATRQDLGSYPWPDPLDPGYTAGLAEETKELHEETDYAIMADGGFKSLSELGFSLRGYEPILMDLILNPEFGKALMSNLLKTNIAGTTRFLDAVGAYIQAFRTGDDLAIQKGSRFHPRPTGPS